jgi:hypothetical protein
MIERSPGVEGLTRNILDQFAILLQDGIICGGKMQSVGVVLQRLMAGPASHCAALFSIFDHPTLLEALIDGAFEINCTRRPGGSDVRVPVNIIRDKPETAQEFAACTLKLIEVMRKKFGD